MIISKKNVAFVPLFYHSEEGGKVTFLPSNEGEHGFYRPREEKMDFVAIYPG
jgi:hypothetical protein